MPLIHVEHDPLLDCRPVVTVPAPLTADEARQILADARPWVPLPDGPTPDHLGKRLRKFLGGTTTQGVADAIGGGKVWMGTPGTTVYTGGEWFIHPDDVPDPDADLIDDLATALRKAWDANSGLARYPVSDPVWGDLARVAIERVRAEA